MPGFAAVHYNHYILIQAIERHDLDQQPRCMLYSTCTNAYNMQGRMRNGSTRSESVT